MTDFPCCDGSTCTYCGCCVEAHDINGCSECSCGHSVFFDDDRPDDE